MSAAGLHPTEEFEAPTMVSKDRLAEFDRLYAEGGMEGIMQGLAAAQEPLGHEYASVLFGNLWDLYAR